MSPLEAIAGWLDRQDDEMQMEIATLTAMLLYGTNDILAQSAHEQLETLKRWLNEPNLPEYRAVGRALMFRACFDYYSDRFDETGWELPEKVFRETLAEARRDPNSQAARMASSASRMLDDLPRRKANWRAVGTLWKELCEIHLKNEALSAWSSSEVHESLNAKELPVPTVTVLAKVPPKG